MLVFTTKLGQTIRIEPGEALPWKTPVGSLFANGPIEIVVFAVNDQQVELGIRTHADLVVQCD